MEVLLIAIATLLIANVTVILFLSMVFWSTQDIRKLQPLSDQTMETVGKKSLNFYECTYSFLKHANIYFSRFSKTAFGTYK